MVSITECLKEFAFVGSVLAGFAIAFFVGVLNSSSRSRFVAYTACAAAVASCALIVSTVAGFAGVFYVLDRPAYRSVELMPPMARAAVMGAARWAGASFLLGIAALLASAGLCGWIRSKSLGTATSAVAAFTLALLALLLHWVVPLV